MLMAEQEPYALMVQPDDLLISPREVNDNFGTMVCFHPPLCSGRPSQLHGQRRFPAGNVSGYRRSWRGRAETL